MTARKTVAVATTTDDGTPVDPAAEWVSEYPEDVELFGATFEADDFDSFFGEAHPDGASIAVQRFTRYPSPGWIRRHLQLSEMQRTFVLLEAHASDKALAVIDALTQDAWDEFVGAWIMDGGAITGPKLPKSATPQSN